MVKFFFLGSSLSLILKTWFSDRHARARVKRTSSTSDALRDNEVPMVIEKTTETHGEAGHPRKLPGLQLCIALSVHCRQCILSHCWTSKFRCCGNFFLSHFVQLSPLFLFPFSILFKCLPAFSEFSSFSFSAKREKTISCSLHGMCVYLIGLQVSRWIPTEIQSNKSCYTFTVRFSRPW